MEYKKMDFFFSNSPFSHLIANIWAMSSEIKFKMLSLRIRMLLWIVYFYALPFSKSLLCSSNSSVINHSFFHSRFYLVKLFFIISKQRQNPQISCKKGLDVKKVIERFDVFIFLNQYLTQKCGIFSLSHW